MSRRRALLLLLLLSPAPGAAARPPGPTPRLPGRSRVATRAKAVPRLRAVAPAHRVVVTARPPQRRDRGATTRTSGAAPRRATAPPPVTLPRVVADPTTPHERRVAALRARLETLLHEAPLRRTACGVEVMTLAGGDVLFSHRADRLFNPASNTKILTTAAAMAALGADYRYRTRLVGGVPDEAGVVHGGVELRGAGDPSLSSLDLARIAGRMAGGGVTRIDGDVVADGRFVLPSGERVGDGAISLDRNVIEVHVEASEPKRPALVHIEPPLPGFFVLDNRAVTVARRRSRLRVEARQDGEGHVIVTVRGRIAERGEARLKRRLPRGPLFAAAMLRQALIDFGVEVSGVARGGSLSGELPALIEYDSAPLSEVSRIANKPSNNFVADAIFKTLGGERYGLPPTLEKGARAVKEVLAERGLDPAAYFIENGSGLTHRNRLRPHDLTRLLRRLYDELPWAPEFLSSLAVGGVDGTIRDRFAGSPASRRVRAKTGTLSGVSALSGYVGDANDVVVFTIFVEGARRRATPSVRRAQVQMVEAMFDFLRADQPTPPLPTAAPRIEPLDDDEVDDDPASSEL